MNTELMEALNVLEKEKNIRKEVVLKAIEESLVQACKHHFVEAYHYESKSRGEDTENKEKQERFAREYSIFVKRWWKTIGKGDPYFNINYRLDTDIPKINYNKIN